MTPSHRCFVRPLAGLLVALAAATAARAQTTYTWNDSTTDWTAAAAWTPSGPDWTSRSRLDDAIAEFAAQGTIANPPTIGANTIFANGITIDNSGAAWNINGTGTIHLGGDGLTVASGGATQTTTIAPKVSIAAAQTWDVDTGNTVTLSGALSGGYLLTKAGAGTLALNSNSNTFFGGFAVDGGTLSSTSPTNAFRANSISLGSGVTFTPGANARFGALSGTGTFSNSTSSVFQTLLEDATFSGTVTNGTWEYRGAGTQTFTGDTSALNGISRIYGVWTGTSGVTTTGLTISGSSALTSGSVSMILRGGTFTIDNSVTDVSAGDGRLRDAASFFVQGGGVLKYNGFNSASDITESLNDLTNTMHGMIRVDVTHGGGTGKTVLNFDTYNPVVSATQHFVAAGGADALDGTGAKVTFNTSPPVNNGVMAAGTGDTAVRGSSIATSLGTTNFATYDGPTGTNTGVIPITPTALADTFSATSLQNVEISSAVTADTTGGYLGRNTVTFRDGGSLDIAGANHFGAYAYLFTGSGTAGITSSGTGQIAGGPNNSTSASSTTGRFFLVTDPAGVLSVSTGLAGVNAAVSKSGDGTLALGGWLDQNGDPRSQLAFTTAQNVYILQGVLRGTTAALGGGAAGDGDFTRIRLHGGVLEIDGAASPDPVAFSRALVTADPSASGGTILWTASASQIGSGGFSAINAPGGVDVTLVDAIGGSTAATLAWNTTPFVSDGFSLLFGSRSADSRITLTNNIQLDAGSVTGYQARSVHVYDNTSSTADYARLSGALTGSVSADLLKTGPGTLELTGNNTYAGNTLVHGGTLWANNTTPGQSSTGSGTVVVMSGATLGGRGNIGGSIFARSGGTVAPGDISSATATLTVANGVTLDGGSAFNVSVTGATAGSGYDQLLVTGGDVALAGTLNVDFNPAYAPTSSDRIFVIDNTGTGKLSGTFSNYASSGALVTNHGGFDWRIYYGADAVTWGANGSNAVVLVPVPEPAHYLLACAAAGGLGGALRRWRRRAAA